MKRLHWSFWLGAAAAGLPTFAVLGLIAFAALSLRSPGSQHGAEPAAWIIGYAAVILVSLGLAMAGGLIATGLNRLVRRARQPQKL